MPLPRWPVLRLPFIASVPVSQRRPVEAPMIVDRLVEAAKTHFASANTRGCVTCYRYEYDNSMVRPFACPCDFESSALTPAVAPRAAARGVARSRVASGLLIRSSSPTASQRPSSTTPETSWPVRSGIAIAALRTDEATYYSAHPARVRPASSPLLLRSCCSTSTKSTYRTTTSETSHCWQR